jgi:hypothetical protein
VRGESVAQLRRRAGAEVRKSADKCEKGGDCIEFAYFEGKLDFNPEDSSRQRELHASHAPADARSTGSLVEPFWLGSLCGASCYYLESTSTECTCSFCRCS